ncbi:MAG: glycoside hydrolase family 2 protein [Baekduiaceae bacterium]
MTSPRTLLTLLVALAAAFAVTSPAAAQSGISKTGLGYETGPDNRLLLGGEWLFRLDKTGLGDVSGFQKQTTREGWAPTTVPNAWNATDTSVESMTGTIGWYRKDFKLPSASKRFSYVIRFESVNYRAKVWLNGKPVGGHTGAYLPWEVRLPAGYLKRDGTNRLVIRVDNRRYPTDFPPSGLTAAGTPTGGWWNYGGILREVYLRQIDRVDINSVIVRPELDCAACDAKVLVRATLRNYSDSPERVRATVNFGGKPMMLGSAIVGAKKFATFSRRITVRNPKLWEPGSPNLYTTRISVRGRGENALRVGWLVKTGIRSIKLQPDGTMLLNGKKLNYRGMGIHEDDPNLGFAIGSAQRRAIIAETKEIGATLLRSHYPLHPQLHELADEAGIMIWSEIPVYAVKTQYLKQAAVRQLAAKELEDNIVANQNHPSVIVWSIGNELSSRPGPVQGLLHRPRGPPGQGARPDASRRHRRRRLPERGLPGRIRAGRRHRHQRVLRLVPGAQRRDRRSRLAVGVPRQRARLLPDEVRRRLRVRRRGEPQRARRGEGHGRVPAGLRPLPHGRVREQAVARRRGLLGAARVPGAPGLGGRQPAPELARPRKGPAALRRQFEEAGVAGHAAGHPADAAARPAGHVARRGQRGASRVSGRDAPIGLPAPS